MPKDDLYRQLFNTPAQGRWQETGIRKRSGVLVPLFYVYSKESLGVGELEDLKLLIDWAAKTGNSILQLLPMNELGSAFCPYDALSSFALEPVYLSVRKMPGAKTKLIKARIEALKRDFAPENGRFNYGVKKEKLELLREIYLCESGSKDPDFKKFKEENSYWLADFAFYKTLKDYHRGRPWYEWEDGYRNRDTRALEDFRLRYEREINFQVWLQWQLWRQLQEIKAYASAKRVLLKGDLPILVSRDSSDVWAHPEFFKLEYAAGAPPDMYCAKGQRWGMPTNNWEAIAADGYRYLKERLKYAANFYHILRIDHVVGLFRIWSIPYNEPLENQGLGGAFDPADEQLWLQHGRSLLLAMLENSRMLLCAEDLGVIPKACPDTLEQLGIPGNDVQRWAKDWKIKHDFLPARQYRPFSVAMLSTHDTTNWPAWWENEAGTVDEALFIRKCTERGIDYNYIKDKLFDPQRSRYGRLRWQEGIASADMLLAILGRRKEEVQDLLDLYENTYLEKEKLWKHLGLEGAMQEKADRKILRQALKFSLDARSIFCINLVTDWLYLGGIFKGEPYQYRINTPGTACQKNWSLVSPISLEELLKHKVNKEIRKMIIDSGRGSSF